MKRVRPTLFDLALVTAFVVAAFWRIIFTNDFFYTAHQTNDWQMLAQPAYTYTGQSLIRGEFPLWNTHWFAGYPHYAVPSNSVLYPTTILYGIFSFTTASKILALGHVYLFALLSYALGRHLYRSRLSAIFLALSAALGSVIHWPLSAGNLWTITTLTWLPLAFLALRHILLSGSRAWALALAPAIALMALGGDPLSMAFALAFLGLYAACSIADALIDRNTPRSEIARKGALAAVAAIGGLALAAVQLIPTQEFIHQSVRKNGVTFNYWHGYFDISLLDSYQIATIKSLDSISYIDGKVVLALTFVALFGHAFREARIFWFVTVLLWTLGDAPRWFFDTVLCHIPVLNGMRGATPYALVAIYLSYLLAGSGLDTLIDSIAKPDRRRAPWLAATAISSGFLIVAAFNDPSVATSLFTVPILVALTVAMFRVKLPHAAVALTLFALAASESISRFGIENYHGDPKRLEVNKTLSSFSHARTDLDRVLVLGPAQGGIRQGPAVTLLTGDRNIEGYHALFLHRYARLLRDVAGVPIATLDAKGRLDAQGDYGPDWVNAAALPILDLFNVRYILRNRAVSSFVKSEIDAKSGRFSFEVHDGLRVYKNHAALPPVFPIHEIEYVPSDEAAIALLREGRLDYRKRATLSPEFTPPPLALATGPEPITLINYGPNSIEATISLTAPALLVLSEMWYPGWYAQVDGGPAQPVLCVNTALQATPVPAGDHTVRFFFRPRSVIIGAVISAVAMLAWIASLLVIVFRRRRKPPGANQGPICID